MVAVSVSSSGPASSPALTAFVAAALATKNGVGGLEHFAVSTWVGVLIMLTAGEVAPRSTLPSATVHGATLAAVVPIVVTSCNFAAIGTARVASPAPGLPSVYAESAGTGAVSSVLPVLPDFVL